VKCFMYVKISINKNKLLISSLLLMLCLTGCGKAGNLQENKNYSSEVLQTQTEEALPNDDTIPPPTPQPTSEPTATPAPTPIPEPPTITLAMVGDMLMHEKVMESGLQEDGSYEFGHLFQHVEDRIQEADLALVNQETILGGTQMGLTGYPCFNSPYELGVAEVEAGFDVILHATNHALDKGKKGAMNCMDFWKEQYPEVPYLGINESKEQQDRIYIYEQEGMKLAILNYTYGTNGISTPADMPYLVNYLEKEQVVEDLQQANELADFTIVCPHWGKEYSLGVSAEQESWSKIFLENGVDLVLGTHPHVIEPVKWVADDNGNQMLVYYSLGNFVNGTSGTGEGVMNRCVGGLAEVEIGRDEVGQVVIKRYDCIPLVCHIAEGDEYTVWFLEDYTEELAAENAIIKQDSDFSLENCKVLVEKVWGESDSIPIEKEKP